MTPKSRAIIEELIAHGHKFKGYTVQEAKEALQDALDSDPDIEPHYSIRDLKEHLDKSFIVRISKRREENE